MSERPSLGSGVIENIIVIGIHAVNERTNEERREESSRNPRKHHRNHQSSRHTDLNGTTAQDTIAAPKKHPNLVRLTSEDIHILPAPNQSPANTVHSRVGIGLGGLVVVARRDDIGCAALVGGSEGLVAAKAN